MGYVSGRKPGEQLFVPRNAEIVFVRWAALLVLAVVSVAGISQLPIHVSQKIVLWAILGWTAWRLWPVLVRKMNTPRWSRAINAPPRKYGSWGVTLSALFLTLVVLGLFFPILTVTLCGMIGIVLIAAFAVIRNHRKEPG